VAGAWEMSNNSGLQVSRLLFYDQATQSLNDHSPVRESCKTYMMHRATAATSVTEQVN
jgi:hypothetical protein